MKLSLSENIRSLRRQRKITQAKLAEALGVTVGAVYKWESGQSLPELNLVVELADFFDISVDVLLGYHMKDNSLDSALNRIASCCKTLDPAALTEAEKMLARYPHSFRAVYGCASVYLAFGASGRDPAQLRRALELLEQSKAPKPMTLTLSGTSTVVRPQSLKAFSSMAVTCAGMLEITEGAARAVQPSNMLAGIVSKLAPVGQVTLAKLVQSLKISVLYCQPSPLSQL